MHELSLCEGIIQALETSAHQQRFQRVLAIWLEIGTLASVEKSAMLFSFDAVSRGTLAEGARLHMIDVSADAWCMPCGKPVAVKTRFDACPSCGSYQLQISGGDALKIKELEVE